MNFRFKKSAALFALAMLLIGTSACSVVSGVSGHVKGGYYLSEHRYSEGLSVFRDRLRKNPNDPVAQFYTGRYLLALDKPKEALLHLQKAVQLNPGQAENHFWLGVAYWSVKDYKNERASYIKAIERDFTHVPAHVYLAHNYLDRREYKMALATYDKALKLDPYQPEALFGRANALNKLRRTKDEVAALKKYLEYYPDGSLARNAADRLNKNGDFSFRNFALGPRLITLEWIKFEPKTAKLSPDGMPSLRVIGGIMESNKRFKLRIESYYKGNEALARARAETARDFITERFSSVDPGRFQIKAFGRPERVNPGTGAYELDSSIVFETVK